MTHNLEQEHSQPDPLDDAIHLNTPEGWNRVLSDQRTLGETELNPFETSPATVSKLLRGQVEDVVASLTSQERRVIQLSFGLLGKQMTQKQIGREMGFSERTARRRIASGLAKLRHPNRYNP